MSYITHPASLTQERGTLYLHPSDMQKEGITIGTPLYISSHSESKKAIASAWPRKDIKQGSMIVYISYGSD